MLSAHIDIKKFTEFFDAGNNTYPRFQYVLDSLKVEAVLLINRTGYQHVPVTRPGDFNTPANIYQSGSKTGWVDAAYKCYLIKPHSFFPIWSAKFDFIKGSKASIRKAMAKQLLKSLHDGQYIF
ncbi:MAG: hypothetical protein JST47_14860 [Bacteroidetes bacterium]|nr:hypothetical protein [Bacteroidota bacterium]